MWQGQVAQLVCQQLNARKSYVYHDYMIDKRVDIKEGINHDKINNEGAEQATGK